MSVKLTYNQRHFVFEKLNKVFSSVKLPEVNNKRIVDIYGATTQALLREALHTFCFTYPLNPEIKKKSNGINSEKKETFKNVYVFKIKFPLPIFGGEIVLEQEIDKEVLEKH